MMSSTYEIRDIVVECSSITICVTGTASTSCAPRHFIGRIFIAKKKD